MPRSPLYVDRDPGARQLADAIESPGPVDPNLALPLRAHSVKDLAELRITPGSTDGVGGPRACMLAGQLNPLDAAAGIFIWDATSTLADNTLRAVSAFTVCKPVVAVAGRAGRWRRLSLGSLTEDRVKILASYHP